MDGTELRLNTFYNSEMVPRRKGPYVTPTTQRLEERKVRRE